MKTIYLSFLLFFCLTTTYCIAQQRIIMTVSDVTGSSKYQTGAIDLTSVSFEEKSTTSISGTGGSGSSTTNFSDITITQILDLKSSPMLMGKQATGTRISKVTIGFYDPQADAKDHLTYSLELSNVLITDHSVSLVPNCPNGCAAMTESLHLAYERIEVTTYPPGGSSVVFVYDLKKQ